MISMITTYKHIYKHIVQCKCFVITRSDFEAQPIILYFVDSFGFNQSCS